MIYQCCSEARRAAVLGNPNLNGIDYLEVLDHDAIALNSPRQQTLMVTCLRAAPELMPANILIAGGESITGIKVQWVATALAAPVATAAEQAYFAALPEATNVLIIRTSVAGDFSTYTLRLVNNATQAQTDPFEITEALTGFDPILSTMDFGFKVECGPAFDCQPAAPNCAPPATTPPPINYLAKDYGSFRSILLDRMNQLLPNWNAGSEADLGVALAELLAYVGDRLSYQQDAIATEAYLQTARSRISLRRHAKLVDYQVNDGCNARAWVQFQVNAPVLLDRTQTRCFTVVAGAPKDLAPGAGNEEAALLDGVIGFEPMQDQNLFPAHNRMQFYSWGDTACCLPAGATEATLAGSYPDLQPGDVLIFQEVQGPLTGLAGDADMTHRCAVRLTQVGTMDGQGRPLVDPLFEAGTGAPITAPAIQAPAPVTEIQWAAADALPFAVCVSSSIVGSSGENLTINNVSVAVGNVVLVDQGLTMTGISLGAVPAPTNFYPAGPAADRCAPATATALPVRFRPMIPDSPITQAVPLSLAGSPVTPAAVMLSAAGFVSLNDSGGDTSVLVAPNNLFAWPQFFAVQATQNTANAALFDLTVLYWPAGAASGVKLEIIAGCSQTPADPNYAPKLINALSNLVRVPPSYAPPAPPVGGFGAPPVNLSLAGPSEVVTAGMAPFLTVQPASPASWAGNFGVIAQGNQKNPDLFNLLVVYDPAAAVGVSLPVTVLQVSKISLATAAASFSSAALLITVKSFADAPSVSLPASALTATASALAVPAISLTGTLNNVASAWTCAPDLLESNATDKNFVLEVERTGVASLRFGDGVNGAVPDAGTVFTATYRVGNGSAGNVGAGSLVGFAGDPRITGATNPMPANGGTDPESNDQIRRHAPQQFLTQERAVTMGDYEALAVAASRQVAQATATLRWTGSWYTAFVAAEPVGGGSLIPALQQSLLDGLARYRMAGQDLAVAAPQYVPLDVELQICVDPGYFQADVEQALLLVLSDNTQPNGVPGVFAPANFGFGETVYLSPIIAAAVAVAGVISVTATVFQPMGAAATSVFLNAGKIPLGAFQVARLANNPSFPDRGRLVLTMAGGK